MSMSAAILCQTICTISETGMCGRSVFQATIS